MRWWRSHPRSRTRSQACFVRRLFGTSIRWPWHSHTKDFVMNLLSLRLTISYKDKPPVLDDLQLELYQGEVLGLVGHSGCGKSSLALAILGLLNLKGGSAHGSIRWNGHELLTLKEREWRKLRGKEIAFVPQSPMSSLNPALRLGTQLEEAWKLHGNGGRRHKEEAIFRALMDASLPP